MIKMEDLEEPENTTVSGEPFAVVQTELGWHAFTKTPIEDRDGTKASEVIGRVFTPDEKQNFRDAHAEGLHEDLRREGCPDCFS